MEPRIPWCHCQNRERQLLAVRADDPRGHRRARLRDTGRPIRMLREALAVGRRDRGSLRVDEVGERVRQTEFGRPDGALRGGAEQPGLGKLGPSRQGRRQPRERMLSGNPPVEVGEQLRQLVQEHAVRTGSRLAAGLLADWPRTLAGFRQVVPLAELAPVLAPQPTMASQPTLR